MTITAEIFKVIETAPLFLAVSRKLLIQKLSGCEVLNLKSSETLMVPGQVNKGVYIIISGRISIQTSLTDADPIAMLGEGECVGETSIVGDVHVPAFFIASTDCTLVVIDHSALWQLIDHSHQAAHNALSVLSMRVRVAHQVDVQQPDYNSGYSYAPLINDATGLYNGKWLEKKVERYLERFIFCKAPCCLMLVSIDYFHELGETYGQYGCEEVMRHTAHVLQLCLLPDDHVGHIGMEKFGVFMPNTSLTNAYTGANRLKKMINESVVELPSGDALPPISISIGICPAVLENTLETLFARTGEALQVAINSGGNCIKCYNEDEIY